MRSKPIWKTKTFWLQVLGVAAMVQPIVPVPPAAAAYVWGGLNIAVRLLTKGPAHVIKDAAEDP